jgi:Protein of unknown function (DUF3307)
MSPVALQLLVCLVAAHAVGDFVLQTGHMARHKRRWLVLLRHAGVVAAVSWALCTAWTAWEIPLAVLVAHAAVDAVKARLPWKGTATLLLDQLAHLVTLVAIAWWAADRGAALWGAEFFGDGYVEAMIVLAGATISVFAGAILIGAAVQPLVAQLEPLRQGDAARPHRRGFDNGGKLIGELERGLIFLFVLAGQPASIGLLIAAKSVLRFGELKETEHRMEAEYIIIGTLMSFGFGSLVAFATWAILGRI